MQDVNKESEHRVNGNSLYYLCDFSVGLKLFLKSKVYLIKKKWWQIKTEMHEGMKNKEKDR